MNIHNSAIQNNQKVEATQCPSANEWINKMCYIYATTEYYFAITRSEILIHPTSWMNLKHMMLRERSQSQKVTYGMIPFL